MLLAVLSMMLALVPGASFSPAQAQDVTLQVTSAADDATGENDAACPDDDACTLRAAVEEANEVGGDVEIVLPAGDFQLTNEAGSLQVGDGVTSLTIRGGGSGVDPDVDTILDAGGAEQLDDRILTVTSTEVALHDVRMTGGSAIDGGAISAEDSTLRLIDTAVMGNEGDGLGGGIDFSAGGDVEVELEMTGVDLSENENLRGWGGALSFLVADDAVVDLTVTDSRIDDNVAESTGGGLYIDYSDASSGDMIFDGVDLVGNDAVECCGGAANIFTGGEADVGFTMSDSVVAENDTFACCAAGLWLLPGSEVPTTWTIEDSVIRDNVTDGTTGGGLWVSGGGATALELVRTKVSGNETTEDFGAGIRVNATPLSLIDSAVVDNVSTATGGYGGAGIDVIGDGDDAIGLTMVNSTVSGNESRRPEAHEVTELRAAGISLNDATGDLTNVTVADNVSPDGGDAIYLRGDEAEVRISGTALAGGEGTRCAIDDGTEGLIVDRGGNVADDGSCGLGEADVHEDVLLDELTETDRLDGAPGTTLVHPLLEGSPAIAAVVGDDCPATDQRGAQRPTGGDMSCSSGAFEADAVEPEAGSVTGTVRDADTADGIAATVTLSQDDEIDQTTASEDGAFGFDDLAAGTYTIDAQADGYEAAASTVEVEDGVVTEVALTLEVSVPFFDACPPDEVPDPGFGDVEGNEHEAAIACAAWHGITTGVTEDRYVPGRNVTRAEMASFVARVIEAAGTELPADPGHSFEDLRGSVHDGRIAQLAAVGIIEGRTATSFVPGGEVTRGQTASLLARAYAYTMGAPLPAGPERFDDVEGSVHRGAIEAAAEAGLTRGRTETTFVPRAPTPRDQMASFMTRLLDLFADEGRVSRPDS